MNKQELEKMFNKRFTGGIDCNDIYIKGKPSEFKNFIFNSIIPEVLNSIIKSNNQDEEGNGYVNSYVEATIKQKAKEQFGIDL